jgi:NADH-quinone oxidoreductase subunit L
MPITFATFGLGYLAILGVPPFAGFYSKDMIIETAFNSGGIKGLILGSVTLLGAGITAFYMTRVMILTFTGKSRWDDEAHPHESPWLMWLPMAILAIGSVTSGYLLSHGDALVNWLSPLFESHEEHEELLSPMLVSGLALTMVAIGVAIAFLKYSRNDVSDVAPENVSIFTRIARQDLLQDRFNETVFMRTGQVLTKVLVKTDEVVIDGAVRTIGRATLGSGASLRGVQSGFVRSYAALILVGAVALISAIWVVTQ